MLIKLIFIPLGGHIDAKRLKKGASAQLLVGALAPRSIKRQHLAAAAAPSARHMAGAAAPSAGQRRRRPGAAAPSVRLAARSAALSPSSCGTVCIVGCYDSHCAYFESTAAFSTRVCCCQRLMCVYSCSIMSCIMLCVDIIAATTQRAA